VPTQAAARGAQRHHLGVGGGVAQFYDPVDTLPGDLPADDDRAERPATLVCAVIAG
jgi:hypothetical protein